jgi:preprotein translocase subunit SecE
MGQTSDNFGEGNMATPRPQENTASTESSALQAIKPASWFGGVRQFFHEVSLEMKKVSWPTRTEVVNTTAVVVVAIFFFAFFLFGTDIVLSYLIQLLEAGAKRIFG